MKDDDWSYDCEETMRLQPTPHLSPLLSPLSATRQFSVYVCVCVGQKILSTTGMSVGHFC